MEEEISYSTVTFKYSGQLPKEKTKEPTVYAEVKHKEAATTVSTAGEAAAAVHSHGRVLAVCLVMLCVLLVASIGAIIYITIVMNEQRANLRSLTAENQQLITNRSILERETEKLSRVTENLNWTLGVILEFNTFPVDEYCPEKKCQPCKKDWIMFQEKCYLFYNETPPWMSWGDSQTYCRNTHSDLVVIDRLQEQEFISNHTEPYYDELHGYWLGLYRDDDKNWLWVDGHNDTLSYWMLEELGDPGLHALMIPGRKPTASWDPAKVVMQNKFICEREVLLRSN